MRNAGRGSAFHLVLNCMEVNGELPTAVMSTTRIPILGSGETYPLKAEIVVWWKNVPTDAAGHQHLPLRINIGGVDSVGVRHETVYDLLAIPVVSGHGVADAILPGLMLGSRRSTQMATWRAKLTYRMGRFAGRWSELASSDQKKLPR